MLYSARRLIPSRRAASERFPQARRNRQTGAALIHVTIETDGAVSSLTLARSSGFTLLDNAALDAVRTWRFAPALEDGDPIRCALDVPVTLVLRR